MGGPTQQFYTEKEPMKRKELQEIKAHWQADVHGDLQTPFGIQEEVLNLITEIETAWNHIDAIDQACTPAFNSLQTYRRSFQ